MIQHLDYKTQNTYSHHNLEHVSQSNQVFTNPIVLYNLSFSAFEVIAVAVN